MASDFKTIFILGFAIVSSVYAGPTNYKSTPICATYCNANDAAKLQYEVGTTYVYEYTSNIQTRILEESAKDSQVQLTSNIEIEVVSPCELNLQLKDVKISAPHDNNMETDPEFLKDALEKHPLRFSFHGGHIDHLCSNLNDPTWVLNAKRGIISMLQNTMENLNAELITQEVDINGKCSTQYRQQDPDLSSWGGSITVTKYKDFSACSNRRSHISAIQSVPYSSNSGFRFLSGFVECSQTIMQNKYETVSCREEQILKPFEEQNSGATNIISQMLTLTNSFPTKLPLRAELPVERSTLVYQTDFSMTEVVEDINPTLILLKKLETSSSPSVKAEAPAIFLEIVERLRQLSENALRSLLSAVENDSKMTILMDAIPLVNSAPSMTIMRDYYLDGKLTEKQIQSWLSSVHFIKDPTTDMIPALLPLLEDNPSTQVLLSTSSLINSFCKKVPDCSKNLLVLEVIQKISLPLNANGVCYIPSDDINMRQSVVALKALGNIGIHPDTSTLENCYNEKLNAIEVRLAALDAYRRMSCSSFSNSGLLKLYADHTETTEVRIRAYLGAMRCANRQTLEVVRSVMHTEVVNQVGSFVWTHLTNLKETTRLEKQAIRQLLANEVLQNKFQTDARKFSRNFESSIYSQEYNAGAGIDANVIFTEESFLPKSGMMNLSIQLFGETINIFEFGGRINGAERLLEPIFGPKGYFPDENMSDFLKGKRGKRDVSDQQQIARLSSIYEDADKNDETLPGGSFYARVFGNEIMFKDFMVKTGATVPNVMDENGKTLFSIKTILDNLSTGKKTEFMKSSVLADVTYSVPTSAGFPLNLAFKASTTMGLSAEGKFNVGKYMEKKELELYGLLRPNFAVDVDASLTVRIGARNNFIRSGIAVRNILRSSTAIETNLEIKGTNIVKAALNFPQNRQDIFEASSSVILLNALGNDQELEPIKGLPKFEHKGCLGDKYKDIFGMKICGHLAGPSYFTLTPTTPARVALFVEKTDNFQGYLIDYNYENMNSQQKLSVVFDTPGSTIARRTEFNLKRRPSQGTILATLATPDKVIEINTAYTGSKKSLDLSVVNNGDTLLLLNTSLTRIGDQITPQFTLIFHNRPLAELKGMIQLPIVVENNARKATIDLSLLYVTQTPIRIHGNFLANEDSHEISLGVESFYLTGTMHSAIKNRLGHWSSRSMLEYSWKHGDTNTIDISAKFQKTQKGALSKFSAAANFILSKFPDHHVDFNWETLTSSGFCENVAKLSIGKSIWNGHSLYNRQNTRDLDELRILFSFANPRDDVDYFLEFSHRMLDQSIGTRFTGRTSSKNEVKAKFQYDNFSRTFMSKNVTAEVSWPGTEYSFAATLAEKRKGEFDGELFINLNNFKEMKATITYINKSNNLKFDHLLDFRARGFISVPVSGSIALTVTDKQSHIGCQILLEGKKPYSSRLSTSIDYSHIRNTHKIEAKVTFNERKYNSEIIFGHTKSGNKFITVDLFLEKHIYLEAKMSGSYPEMVTASFVLIPNKDANPMDKLELQGLVSSQEIQIHLNYFEEKVSITGELGDESINGEILWDVDKRVSLTATVSQLTMEEGYFSVELVTPFEYINNATFHWNHKISPEKWNTKIQGNLESKSILLEVDGASMTTQGDFLTTVITDISGYKRTEIGLEVTNRENRRNLRLSVKKDAHDAFFNVDYVDDLMLSVLKLELEGCSAIPELSLNWNLKRDVGHISTIGAKWTFPGKAEEELQLYFEKNGRPTSYNFSLKTPWEQLKFTSGHILLDSSRSHYQLEMDNEGGEHIVPLKLSVGVQGTSSSFDHHMNIQWPENLIKISLSGSAESWSNMDITGSIKSIDHNYSCHITSKNQEGVKKYEIITDFDKQETEIGLTINDGLDKKELTVWGSLFSGPEKKAIILLETEEQLHKISFSLSNDKKNVLKIDGEMLSSSYQFWSVNLKLQSAFGLIPSFDFHSTHNMIDLQNIVNIHHLSLTPSEKSFWHDLLPARNFSVQAIISNLEEIYGSVTWDEKTVNVNGDFKVTSKGHKIQVGATSSLFRPVTADLSYATKSKDEAVVSVAVSHDSKDVFHAEFTSNWQPEMIKFTTAVKSTFVPEIESEISFQSNEGRFKAFLKMDDATVIDLTNVIKGTMAESVVTVELKSDVFELIENIFLDASYQYGDDKNLTTKLKYLTTDSNYEFFGEIGWGGIYIIRLSSKGDFTASLNISVAEMQKLIAIVTYNDKKLGEIQIDYQPVVVSKYFWGKHLILLKFIRGENNPIKINIGVCADPKKFEAEVKTPFQNWYHSKAYLDLNFQSSTKLARLGLHKDQDKLDSSFEIKTFKRNGTSVLTTDVNVKGFKRVREFIFETTDLLQEYKNASNVEGRFAATAKWSGTNLELRFETPVERWKAVKFSGSLDSKRNHKQLLLTCDINEKHHEFRSSIKIDENKGELDFKVKCHEDYVGQLKYDLSSDYQLDIELNGPQRKWSGSGRLSTDNITVNLGTPISGFEKIILGAYYKNESENHQEGGLEWSVNQDSKALAFDLHTTPNDLNVKLRTPVPKWENIDVTLEYDNQMRRIEFNAKRGDGQNVGITILREITGVMTNLSEDSSMQFQATIHTPFENYEKMVLSINYDREASEHSGTIEYNRNNELLKLQVDLLYNNRKPHSIELQVDLSSLQNFNSKARATLSIDPAGTTSLVAIVEFNEFRHEVNAVVDLSDNSKRVKLQTTLSFLKKLEFSLLRTRETTIYGIWEGDKKFEINNTFSFNGLKDDSISLSIISPFQGIRNILLEGKLQLDSNTVASSFTFQNENSRWMTRMDGNYEGLNGKWNMHLNTPVKGYSELIISGKHTWTKLAKELSFTVERKTDKLVELELAFKDSGFQVALVSAIVDYPLSLHSSAKLIQGALSLQTSLSLGEETDKTNVEVNLLGFESGLVNLRSSAHPHMSSRVAWKKDGSLEDGNAWLSVTNSALGSKSVRTLWKIGSWKQIKTEFWIRTDEDENETGGVLQYALTTDKEGSHKLHVHNVFSSRKMSRSVNFIGKFAQEEASKFTGEAMIETTMNLKPTMKFQAVGLLSAKDSEVDFKLNSTLDNAHLIGIESNILVTMKKSLMNLKVDAPIICKPFDTAASYDFTEDKKLLKLTFEQSSHQLNLETYLLVPTNKPEIEMNFNMRSNITLIRMSAGGHLHGSYQFHPDGLTEIQMALKSDQIGDWQFIGSVRPTSDFQLNLDLNSSTPETIPKVSLQANCLGNLRQRFSSNFALKLEQNAFNYSLTMTPDSVKLAINTPWEFLSDFKIEGFAQLDNSKEKEADMKVELNGESYEIMAKLKVPHRANEKGDGVISFTRGNRTEKSQVASLAATFDFTGSAELVGSWFGESVKAKGQIEAAGEGPYLSEGVTNVTLFVNGVDKISILSQHKFRNDEYFLDVATRQDQLFKVQFLKGSTNKLEGILAWSDTGRMDLKTEWSDDKFDVCFSNPWTANATLHGMIQKTNTHTTANGYVIYNQQKSELGLEIYNTNATSRFEISLDIPSLHQKVEATLSIQAQNNYNSGGKFDLNINGRQVSLSGEFLSKLSSDSSNSKNKETKLSLFLTLPSKQFPKIGTQILLKRPLHHNGNMKINANLLVGERTSELTFGYTLPHPSNTILGVHGKLNNRIWKLASYSFNLESSGPSFKHFVGEAKCNSNSVSLNWNVQLPKVNAAIKLATATPWSDFEDYELVIGGDFDTSQILNLTIDARCKDRVLSAQYVVKFDKQQITCEGMMYTPQFEFLNHRHRLQLSNLGNGKYEAELSGMQETFNMQFMADCTVGERGFGANGKLTGSLGALFGRFDYGKTSGGKHEANLTIESPGSMIVGKKIVVKGELTPTTKGFEASLQCRTRKNVHTALMSFQASSNDGKILFAIESQNVEPIFLEGTWTTDGYKFNGKLLGNFKATSNVLEVLLDVKNLEGRVNVDSPLIPSSQFGVHLKSLFHSDGIEVLGDVQIRTYHWRFQGVLNYRDLKQMQAKLEIVTPNESFDRLTLAVTSGDDEMYAEIYTPIKAIPNAVLKFNGLKVFRTKNWKNVDLGLTMGLPFGKYSAFCKYKNWNSTNPGLIHVLIEDGTSEVAQIFEIFTELSPMSNFGLQMNNKAKIHARIITPIAMLAIFEIEMEGRVKGRNVMQLTTSTEFNGDKLSFNFEYDNDSGNPKINSKLSSPFEMYENVSFSLAFDSFQNMGKGRSLHMEFDNPLWTDKITLDADYRYRYEGLLDFEGELNAELISFMELPQIHWKIATEKQSDSGISFALTGNVGSSPGSLKILTNFGVEDFSITLDGKGGEEDFYNILGKIQLLREENFLRFAIQLESQQYSILDSHLTYSTEEDVAGGFLKLITPWGPIRLSLTLIPMSPIFGNGPLNFGQILKNSNATIDLHFAEERLIGFQFVCTNDVVLIDVFNPFRPISIVLNFEHYTKSKLKVVAEFCWDIDNPVGHTVGAGIQWNRGFQDTQVRLNVHAERAGVFELEISHILTSSKFNQTAMIQWDSPFFNTTGESGYVIAMSKDSSLPKSNNNVAFFQLNLPFRSVILELQSNTAPKESLQFMVLKWDAKRDASKILSVKLQSEMETSWRVSETSHFLEITHPQLKHPLMISIDQIYKENRFQHVEMDIKASELPQNNFVFLISRNNTDWKTFKIHVRHVPTNILVAIDAQTVNEGDGIFTEISYMDHVGAVRNLTAEANAANGHYEFGLFSGKSSAKSGLVMLKTQFHQDHIVMNGRLFSFNGDAIVQTTLPFLEAIVKQNGEDLLKISGGFAHKRKLAAHIARLDAPNSVDYLLATVELTSTNTISTIVNWYPNFFTHIVELEIPRMLSSSVMSDINSLGILSGISNEIVGRWTQLSPEVKEIIQTMADFAVDEANAVYNEWKKVAEYLETLYENNVFYIKDAIDNLDFLVQFLSSVKDAICTRWNEGRESLLNVVRMLSETLNNFFESYDGSLEKLVMDYWNRMEMFCSDIWNENMSTISNMLQNVIDASKILLDALEGKIEEVEQKLMATGLCRKLIQLYKDYASWIEELPIQEFTRKLENMMNIRIWDRVTNCLKPILEAIQTGTEDEYFTELLETPPLPYIRYSLSSFHTAFNKIWEALEVEQRLKQLIRASLKNIDGLIHRYLPTATFNYDLDLGYVQYDQSLSAIQWPDFTEAPRWRTTEEEAKDVSQLTNFYFQVMDAIEDIKPIFSMKLRNVMPPFGSNALMAGDYHYFTFDKHYFRFAGECSYLLLADLGQTNDAFSLIVNYENKDGNVRKKSYSITTNGTLVDIDVADFKVTSNGRKLELPLNIGSLFIKRHQTGLEIFDMRGFTMTCSLSYSVCSVGISGWHFGKIGGLLGTYDNEPVNDFQSPDRQLVADVSAFAYSWRVGRNSGTCRMKNFAKDEREIVDVDDICHSLLVNLSSPLRPCFHAVKTDIFMEMCKYDVSRNANNAKRSEAVCSVMSAYVTECQKNKVDVWMPPNCVLCRLEDGTAMTTGENVTLSTDGERPPPKSSDNVILVEETSCVSLSTVNEAIRRLELALNSIGIEDNRYSIIGFGGSDIHEQPHIKTTSSNVWAHHTLFKIANYSTSTTGSKAGLYDAIQYAASLGFRAGVSKNFIAVTCGDEECGDPNRYADILTLLVENDIKLHMLTPKPFTLKGGRKQDERNQIYGIDMAGVYTLKHAKSGEIIPDTALKRQINVPKDFCTPLAMESNGTRFNVEQPTNKVLDVWSRRIAQTSVPSSCQRCECVPDRFGSASLMCHQCVSPNWWKVMEEYNSYQFQDGEEDIPMEYLEQDDFTMT